MTLGLDRLARLHDVPYDKGQTERVNQIVKRYALSMCTRFSRQVGEYHPLAEFSYDKGYQATIKMAPFKGFVWLQV